MSCNICYENDVDCVFIPCGHATSCFTCASAFPIARHRTKTGNYTYTPSCAICRQPGRIYKLYGCENIKVNLVLEEIQQLEQRIEELNIAKDEATNTLEFLEEENESLDSKIQLRIRENNELKAEFSLIKRVGDIRHRITSLQEQADEDIQKLQDITLKVNKINKDYSSKLSEYRDTRRSLCKMEVDINRMVAKTDYLETNKDIVDVKGVKSVFEASGQKYNKQTLKKAIDELCFDSPNKFTYLDTEEKKQKLTIGDEIKFLAFNPDNVKHNLRVSRLFRVISKNGDQIRVDRKDDVSIDMNIQPVFMRVKV